MNTHARFASIIGVSLLALPSFALAAFDVDLRYGDTGSEVAKMQQFLAAQGHFTAEVTGNFYAITLAAVQAFQTTQSISPVSGYWGPLTRSKANAIVAAGGSTGSNVSTGGTSTQSSEIQLLLAQIAALQAQIAKMTSGTTANNTNTNTLSGSTGSTNTNTAPTNTNTASVATPQTFEYLSSFHSGPQSGSDQSQAPYFGQNPSGPWWYGYSDSATGATKFMSWDGTVPSWTGGSGGFPRLYNWGGYVYGSSAIIVWVAPRAGTITVSGSVARQGIGGADATCAGATPIVAYVYQDGKALWSASLMPGDAGKPYSLSGSVNPGSNVSFIMQPVGASPACAIVYWNPTVVLN